MQWFRFYGDTSHDPKIQRLSRIMSASIPETVGTWAIVLQIASNSPDRGKLLLSEKIPYTIEDIAAELSMDVITTQKWVNAFIELQMITLKKTLFIVTNWDVRQPNSDNIAERVRKHRLRSNVVTLPKRNKGVTGNVTVTPPESDTDTESEGDISQGTTVDEGTQDTPSNPGDVDETPLSILGRLFENPEDAHKARAPDEANKHCKRLARKYGGELVERYLNMIEKTDIRGIRVMPYLETCLKNHTESKEVKPNGRTGNGSGKRKTNLTI